MAERNVRKMSIHKYKTHLSDVTINNLTENMTSNVILNKQSKMEEIKKQWYIDMRNMEY